MNLPIALKSASLATVAAMALVAVPVFVGPALAAPTGGVVIEHAAARVIVIPEARGDTSVSVQQGRAGLPALHVSTDGRLVRIDGGLGGFGNHGPFHWGWSGLNCRGRDGHQSVSIPGHGEVAVGDLPVVTVHVPLNAKVEAGDAVFGEVGPTASLDFANRGCGDWRIADVHGPLHMALAGSGDVRGGAAGDSEISVAGSADVNMGAVAALSARVSGSGDIHTASVNGPVRARIAGSGDITLGGGQSPDVGISIAGSGDFRFRGVAGAANVSIAGSGDVDIMRVTGPVSKHVAGSGDVNIGH